MKSFRGALIGAALLALASVPAPAKVFSPTTFKLANGLEVVVIEDTSGAGRHPDGVVPLRRG